MNRVTADSKGLTFLQAAAAAMPKTKGDRDYVSAMSEVMQLAVANRFQFAPADLPALKKLCHTTAVGIFSPLARQWYSLACINGGTYPAVWEKHHQERPWKAPFVLYRTRQHGHIGSEVAVLENNRVCPGLAVVLPVAMADDPEYTLQRVENFPLEDKRGAEKRTVSGQVWWVTSSDDSHIMLCRYAPETRTPVRRKKVLRGEWASLFSH